MKYINFLKFTLLGILLGQSVSAQVINAADYVLESNGDAKFSKAIQAAVIKASAQINGQVFIGAYQGQSTLPITPIKFYDFKIDNVCYNLSNSFNLNCSHMTPGIDEMFGFNGFKNFTIKGYGATFTMPGFDWYKTLSEINHDSANSYQTELAACGERLPDFCTTTSNQWQNTRNCRKESTACLECWTGNHHPSVGPQENFAQGRHGIHLANCQNVTIAGIEFNQIYSDGINLDPGLDQYYRWKQVLPCRNITIKDCAFTKCGRVGVCCCSVNGALITNCSFENNGYVIAGVDIDMEPFNDQHDILDVVIQKCSFKGAANTAISVSPGGMTQKNSNDEVILPSAKRIDVEIKDCVIAETEFGMHHAGGPYVPHLYDQVNINNLTLKKIGHEYKDCVDLPANQMQACKDSLDNFARIGLLFDSRLTPSLVGDWSLWKVNNLVMKEVSTETNGNQFTWHSMPVFIRTSHFLEYFLNNRLGCADDLTECPQYAEGGLVYDELFGGLSLKNMILYDNHGNTVPNVRASKPIARQEFCIVKSQKFDNSYFLPRFANVKSQNVIKVNPLDVEGYRSVFNANSFDCDLVASTYSDDFQLRTSIIKPAVSVTSNFNSVYEGSTASFTLSLSQTVNFPVSVDYQLKGNATNRLDYSYLTGNIIIPANTNNAELAFEIIQDCINEMDGSENMEITLLIDGDETYTIQQKTANTKLLDVDCGTNLVKSNCEQEMQNEENNEEATENTDESSTMNEFDSSNFGVKGGGNSNTTTTEETENTDGGSSSNCKDETIFTEYPWLNQMMNRADCNTNKITVYNGSSFTFVYVEDDISQQLFYQDGTYFCSEQAGFTCLQYYKNIYNLLEINCWVCPQTAECWISGCMIGNACNYNPHACIDDGSCDYGDSTCENPCNCNENNEQNEIFNQYPVLLDLVDLNDCAGTIVELFEYSGYSFIAITNLSGTKLYLDYMGTNLYCDSPVKYYCTNIYNLGAPSKTWQCNSTFSKTNITNTSVEFKKASWKPNVFPNPNAGIFYLSFYDAEHLPETVNIYAANGQLIKTAHIIESVLKIDISAFGNGLFFIEGKHRNYTYTEKVVVN